jgi:hypothetical protein
MSGEEDLAALLSSLAPVLDPELYTFATVSDDELRKVGRPIGLFRETEGISVICFKRTAETVGLIHEGEFRKISFSVHSALDAVGLTAHVSGALAAHEIPCNMVAAFYHDHLFVPAERADEALKILSGLSQSTTDRAT